MSQLERALRRARAEGATKGNDTRDTGPMPRVPNAAFVSPWNFDESQTAAQPSAPDAPGSSPATAHPPKSELAPQFTDFSLAAKEKLVAGAQMVPVLREQFRKIAASLYQLREARPLRILMVASARPGEGKTLTATNLALTLSESYSAKVLLVDADLRRPAVHRLLDVPNQIGLKDQLASESPGPLPTVTVSSHLEVLLAGVAGIDPMSALTSERLRALLRAAADGFDWIVLDTPPVELLPDAKILAGLADAAILVVEAGATQCELSQRAVDAIGRDRVVGAVLNMVTAHTGARGYAYHDYYDESLENHAQA